MGQALTEGSRLSIPAPRRVQIFSRSAYGTTLKELAFECNESHISFLDVYGIKSVSKELGVKSVSRVFQVSFKSLLRVFLDCF